MTRQADAGVTLIEVLVSLALFALIAGAGFSVLDQVLRAQAQTETRLARLTDMQRMMHLVARDLSESLPGTLQSDGAQAAFGRSSALGQITITLALADGGLTRQTGEGARTVLLTDVTALHLRFLDGAGAWHDIWPPATGPTPAALHAVSLTVSLPPGSGDLHRLIAVPRPATQ